MTDHTRYGRLITRAALLLLLVPFALRGEGRGGIRFAWLTDTHVGGATGEADLRASVRDINHLGNVDFVLVSGDVTEYGSDGQLELARSMLDSLLMPYYALPGNHDTKWSESGCTSFPRIFGGDHFVFESGGYRFIGLHQGPRMRMGDGHWAPEDVRWLKGTLETATQDPRQLFFVTHYPLDSSVANWYEVLDLLRDHDTQAILVGHGHADRILSFEGIPGVMSRSNLRGQDSVGGYTIVELQGDTARFSERHTGVRTADARFTLSLGSRSHRDAQTPRTRPDFSVNDRFPGVRTVWRQALGYTIVGSPAVWHNTVIVGDFSGAVTGLDRDDGRTLWTYRTRGPVCSTPAVSEGLVVLSSADGNVYCLETGTGKERWMFTSGRPIVASPLIVDSMVYIGSSQNSFRALSLHTGRLLWEYAGLSGFVETRPLHAGGKIVFGAWDGCLYALEASTGELVWKWRGDRPGVLYSPAACWPVAAQNAVFVAAPDRVLSSIDLSNGETRWRSARYQVRETIGISEDGLRIYARTMRDSIIALDARGTVPTIVWISIPGFGYDINSAQIVEKGGTVFYATKNGILLGLNRGSGDLLWQHRASVGVVNTLLPLDGNTVLFTAVDGSVGLVRVRDLGG